MAQHVSVKTATYECLLSSLNPDRKIREDGEEKLKALQVTEDYPLVLTELSINSKDAAPLRQLAAVMLRQHVDTHWCEQAEKFSPPEVSPITKERIRELVPLGISEIDGRIQNSLAAVISSIAQWDWPDCWPNLFPLLMQELSQGNATSVSGSIKVLADLSQEICSDAQMSQIAPVLLPQLYKIFVSVGEFSARCRCKAVDIFTTIIGTIVEIEQTDKGCVKRLLAPIMPTFVQAFIEALKSEDENIIDVPIKTEIMRALVICVRSISSLLTKEFLEVVTCVWQNLVSVCNKYVKMLHLEEDDEDEADSDGGRVGPSQLVYSIFEFIHVLLDKTKYHPILRKNIQDLLNYIVHYTQITKDKEVAWSQSTAEFVEDEDDDSFSFFIRISANELFQALVAEFEDAALPALVINIKSHLEEAAHMKAQGNPNWWRLHEAVLYTLGGVRMMFVSAIKQGHIQFDLTLFVHNVVMHHLAESDFPFLVGQSLLFTARVSHALPPDLTTRLLGVTGTALVEAQPGPVRVSALRSIYALCDNLKLVKRLDLIVSHLPTLYDGVMAVAVTYGTEVLALALEALQELLGMDPGFAASVADKCMPFLTAAFLKYSHDQHLVMIVKDVVKELSSANPQVVQQRMLPTLNSILVSAENDKMPTSLQPVALEMVEALVRGSADSVPLTDPIISLFPVIANLTIQSDDSSIMQTGGECLRAYVSKSAQQVASWRDERGITGLNLIGSVVSKLLDPKSSEFSAAYVGRLVSLLVSKLGETIADDLDMILRAVLSKLQQTNELTIIQELIMVFARLILVNVEFMLDFLTMTPGPDGTAALNFILSQWLSRQHIFYGSYETKVGAMALAKLLLHTITTNDARLQNINIREEVVSQSSVIRTRSKAKSTAAQFVDVPALVKIYKLLINELSHQLDEKLLESGNGDGSGDAHGDGSDDDDEEDYDGFLDILGEYEGDLEDDDPDVLNDPINQVNLKDYLTQFLIELSHSQYFASFKPHHTVPEEKILQHIGIATN